MILATWGSGEASSELTDRALWSETKIMKKLPAIQAPIIKLAIRRVCTCFSVPWRRWDRVSVRDGVGERVRDHLRVLVTPGEVQPADRPSRHGGRECSMQRAQQVRESRLPRCK